jgi:hypothetical protein
MSTETRHIGKYELREHLRQDQMAETWKAYDDQAQRFVVLKILHEHLHNDPYFFTRFEREAKEIKSLRHPNLLQVHNMQISYPLESQRITAYIVMDNIEGQTLADYLHSTSYQRRFPSIADIIYLFDSIGSAIDYAHQKGIKYCNVRPSGLNDQLQLVLSNMPDPAPNKSYYLWLLSDVATKPTRSIALGTAPVNHGNVNRLYTTQEHTNLIAYTSRLLITEENTNPAPQQFSPDQRTWRYYAEIPQRTPSPGAPQLGAIKYLRFLIFESNKMIAQGIHGGSVTLVLRNTQKVLEWAGSARDDWALQHFDLIHRHFIRILDYIDGSAFVDSDLPPGTPLLVNPLLAQNGLMTIVPGENPEAYPPRAAFSILSFIQAAPNLAPEKRQLGLQAEKDIRVTIAYHLQQVRLYAKRLVAMSNAQLAQKSTVSLLDSMLEQVRIAYSGNYDPTVNRFLGGALNDYNTIQFLAGYDIAQYRKG